MRYKEIFLENKNQVYKQINTKNIDFNNCKIAIQKYKKNIIIYRGISSNMDFMFGDHSNYVRKSAYIQNYYTEIIDNSPEWKEYPKRSKSFICTTSYSTSQNYGSSTYIVLPFDNPTIGICPFDDLWDSFDLSAFDFDSLEEFNAGLENIMSLIMGNTADTYNNILKLCSIIDKKQYEESILKDDKFFDYLSKSGNSLHALQNILSPSKNYFSKVKLSSLSNISDNEIWFSGPAYFIKQDIINDFL